MNENRWMEDSQSDFCLKCKTSFTLFNRRHHCKRCGKLFCHDCCGELMHIPKEELVRAPANYVLAPNEMHRCCVDCSLILSRRNPVVDELNAMEYIIGQPFQKFFVNIPHDIKAEQIFKVSLGKQICTLKMPKHLKPGDRIIVKAPIDDSMESSGKHSNNNSSSGNDAFGGHKEHVSGSNSSGKVNGSGSGSAKNREIACPSCTYSNKATAKTCEICGEAITSEQNKFPVTRVLEIEDINCRTDDLQEYFVHVPSGIEPGDIFAVDLEGRIMSVACPRDARQGFKITVIAPKKGFDMSSAFLSGESFGQSSGRSQHENQFSSDYNQSNGRSYQQRSSTATTNSINNPSSRSNHNTNSTNASTTSHVEVMIEPIDVSEHVTTISVDIEPETSHACTTSVPEGVNPTPPVPSEPTIEFDEEQINSAIQSSISEVRTNPLIYLPHLINNETDQQASSLFDVFEVEDSIENDLRRRRRDRKLGKKLEPIVVDTESLAAEIFAAELKLEQGKSTSTAPLAPVVNVTVDAPVVTAKKATIHCTHCTYENDSSRVFCEICENTLTGSDANLTEAPAIRAIPSSGLGMATATGVPVVAQETIPYGPVAVAEACNTCPVCTLDNPPEARICEACQHRF